MYKTLHKKQGSVTVQLRFARSSVTFCAKRDTDVEALRKKYMDNPPEGLTSTDIRHMSEEDLLDMDYFLNDDDLDEEFGEEGFYLF